MLGTIGGGDGFDRFSFTIEPGEQLDEVTLTDFVGAEDNAVRFFTGTDTGADPPAFLGETFMSTTRIGADYLALVGIGPLEPGVYSIAIVNVSGPVQQYAFALRVPEPEQGVAALGSALGLLLVSATRRARPRPR